MPPEDFRPPDYSVYHPDRVAGENDFTIDGNTLVVELTNAANEWVEADAIRIERVLSRIIDDGDPQFSTDGFTAIERTDWDLHYAAAGSGDATARWTFADQDGVDFR